MSLIKTLISPQRDRLSNPVARNDAERSVHVASKQLVPESVKQLAFTPASSEVDWTYINTLIHGPGASDSRRYGDANSAVFACLMAIATAYIEPPLAVMQDTGDDDTERLPESPLQGLLDYPTPNGELSPDEMNFWTAWAIHADGNAYWLKVRSGNAETGNVVQLWPISPTLMYPVTEKTRTGRSLDWISYYRLQVAPNEFENISIQNVIHFRLGIDDKDMRKGLSPLKALVRQIGTDEEADKFVEALLRNFAVPGLIVSPSGGQNMTDSDAQRVKEGIDRKFGNDNRGNTAVISKESNISQLGFSPKDLDMSILHRIPEERISAVMGVPAIIAGLGAGLDRGTYSNARELNEMFTERKLVPQWRTNARKLTTALKPDFTSDRRTYIVYDLSDVRALQEDEDAKYSRLQKAVGKSWMTRNEARKDIGLDPVDEWDKEDLAPPQPIPPQLQDQDENQDEGATGVADQDEPEERALDLERWERKAIKALERGKSAAVPFTSPHIPESLAWAIGESLAGAKTKEQVNHVFSDLWLGYP